MLTPESLNTLSKIEFILFIIGSIIIVIIIISGGIVCLSFWMRFKSNKPEETSISNRKISVNTEYQMSPIANILDRGTIQNDIQVPNMNLGMENHSSREMSQEKEEIYENETSDSNVAKSFEITKCITAVLSRPLPSRPNSPKNLTK